MCSRLSRFLWVFGLAVLTGTGIAGPVECEEFCLYGIWDFYPEGGTNRFDSRVPSFWDTPQDYGYPAEWLPGGMQFVSFYI